MLDSAGVPGPEKGAIMIRKLVGLALMAALGYGVYTFADSSNFFGTRDADRNARMEQLQSAADQD